jgi:hypothetical protein
MRKKIVLRLRTSEARWATAIEAFEEGYNILYMKNKSAGKRKT